MPSGDGPRSTLARRLAWTLALTSTLAAAVATGTALWLADVLVVDQVERSAADAAKVLSAELDETPALIPEIEEEARELGIDMRVAVARNGRAIAGDPAVVVASSEPCTRHGAGRDLVCRRAMASDPAVVVVCGRTRRASLRSPPTVRPGGDRGAAGGGRGGGRCSGRTMARRFLAPLERLRRTVVDVDASAPASVHLPAPTGLAELDALRSALASLLERLDDELQRTRRFAANAAHELRTPLTKIGVELELAAEGAAEDAPATFVRLRRTTERLGVLLERLLLLATPHEALETEQGTSMSALAESLPEAREPEHAARLRIETPDADGLVRGDPVLLTAALDNAVDNALKFSSGPVTVTVHEDPGAGTVVVDVDDEGPGVPEDRAAELFEPFARDASARPAPATAWGWRCVPTWSGPTAVRCGSCRAERWGRGCGSSCRVRIEAVSVRRGGGRGRADRPGR